MTGDALDFALAALELEGAVPRERLLGLYRTLDAFPDAPETLRRVKAAGLPTAILSNGSPAMLQSAVAHAGVADLFDLVLSVEEVGVFKPHPKVYQLAVDRLGVRAAAILFVSSNGWDAAAAAAFGMRALWCNRYRQPRERLPGTPEREIHSLAELPPLVGG